MQLRGAIEHYWHSLHRFSDYIPIVSSCVSVIDLFQKYAVLPTIDRQQIVKSHYYTSLKDTPISRYVLLLIPGVNFLITLYDWWQKRQRAKWLEQVCAGHTPLHAVPSILRNDRRFVLEVLDRRPDQFKWISKEMKSERSLMLAFIPRYPEALVDTEIDQKLKDDKYFILSIIRANSQILRYLNLTPFETDREIVWDAINRVPAMIRYASDRLRGDKAFMSQVVRQYGWALQYGTINLKSDPEMVSHAVRQEGSMFQWFVEHEMNNNKQVVQSALQGRFFFLQDVGDKLKENRHVVLAAIRRGALRAIVGKTMKRNKEVVLAAVRICGSLLEDADQRLRGDEKIVRTAVKQDPYALQYASPFLQNHPDLLAIREARLLAADDEAYVMSLIRSRGGDEALKFASDRVRRNRLVMLAAVQGDGHALTHARLAFREDREVLLTAIQQNEEAFVYASAALQGSYSFVQAAVERNARVLMRVNRTMRENRQIVLTALHRDGMLLSAASRTLRGDREVVMAAVRQNGDALQYASDQLKGDSEVIAQATQNNPFALRHASLVRLCLHGENLALLKVSDDKEMMMELVKRDGLLLREASPRLQQDEELVKIAVQQNGEAIQYASAILKNQKEVIRAAVQSRAEALKWVDWHAKRSKSFAIELVSINGKVLKWLSYKQKDDMQIVKAALQQNPWVLPHASPRLQQKRLLVALQNELIASYAE